MRGQGVQVSEPRDPAVRTHGPVITKVEGFAYWPERSIKPQLVVRLATTDGIVGWGEAGFTYREQAVLGALSHLASLVIGKDAFAIGAIWQEMYRRHYFEGCRATSAAMSAIDVALHDIKGKALGVPVHQLLGGPQRDRVRCFATTTGDDPDAMVASALDLRAKGFEAIRLHVLPSPKGNPAVFDPREAIVTTAAATRAVRAALGEEVVLGLDFHHRLSPAEAAAFCQRLPDGTLDFLEEPIRAQSSEAYLALRELTRVPFAIGEEFSSKWEFRPFIDQGLLQFARVDVAVVGGLTEAMKICGWCEANYIDVMPHNPLGPINTAATLHLAVAIQGMSLLEVRQHQVHAPLSVDAHIYPDQHVMSGVAFDRPDAPGLGVTVDEDALREEAARYRFGHQPRFVARDGGLTNV